MAQISSTRLFVLAFQDVDPVEGGWEPPFFWGTAESVKAKLAELAKIEEDGLFPYLVPFVFALEADGEVSRSMSQEEFMDKA